MHESPLIAWHRAHQGRLVDFAGWSMPVLYTSIADEHNAVRKAAGLFDISHMGRLQLTGGDVDALAAEVVTCPTRSLSPGQIRYGLVTNEQGGIRDDVLVYRVEDRRIDLVVNAANREKLLDWIDEQRAGREVALHDATFETAMLALQGPESADWLAGHLSSDAASLRFYHFLDEKQVDESLFGIPARISRTGYTGEDGFEFIVPAERGVELADRLLELGPEEGGPVPCGLGSRDTLRLEAAMPLYGHELAETIDPITAGLAFAVSKKKNFIGAEPIAEKRREGPTQKRLGLRLEGRRIARQGAAVLLDQERIGTVTSGTFSPTLQASIAMAYVDSTHAASGTQVDVEIRGKRIAAALVNLPFYQRP